MAERFFTKVANDVLAASEQLSNRLEDGIAAILTGELALKQKEGGAGTGTGAGADSGSGSVPPQYEHEFDDQFDIPEEELRHNPLQGIAESVVGDIMGGQSGPQTPREHLDAFRQAITWSEPFILGLAAFQLVMFILCLWASRRNAGLPIRIVLMVTIAVLVKSAEYLNQTAGEHWEKFATQNYFDDRGIFVAIMFCSPLLLDTFLMLVMFLREAGQLLVQVKTAEFKKKRQPTKEGEEKEGSKEGKKKRRSKKQQ